MQFSTQLRLISRLSMGTLLAVGLLLGGAIPAQATPVTWFLQDWVFSDGNTASGSYVFNADLPTSAPNRYTDIDITSTIGPTIFTFAAEDATSDQLAFVTGDPSTDDLTGTFALLGELPNSAGMTNAGGTIDLMLDGGMNFNSSQTVCITENCDTSNPLTPIYLVSGSITTVPEPGTALLMGLGLAGLGSVGRSRRQESKSTT